MQKQKILLKPTKESSENETTLPSGESGELQQQNGETKPSSQTSFSESSKPEKQSSDNRAEPVDLTERERIAVQCNKTNKSNVNMSSNTSGSKTLSAGSVLPPSHRPKSRIAAKFPAAN